MYLLIDDDPRATDQLKLKLRELAVPADKIVEAHRSDEAVSKAHRYHPSIIFLDIEMPGRNGFDLWTELRDQVPQCAVVITTAHDRYVLTALRFRMVDYLQKPIILEELAAALGRCEAILNNSSKNWDKLQAYGVTKRQIEIVKLAHQGYTSQQIGDKLFLSKHTVDTHRRNVLKKTECSNILELNRLL